MMTDEACRNAAAERMLLRKSQEKKMQGRYFGMEWLNLVAHGRMRWDVSTKMGGTLESCRGTAIFKIHYCVKSMNKIIRDGA